MGTPASELESKYFIEGGTLALFAGKSKNFCVMNSFFADAVQLAFCGSHLG